MAMSKCEYWQLISEDESPSRMGVLPCEDCEKCEDRATRVRNWRKSRRGWRR